MPRRIPVFSIILTLLTAPMASAQTAPIPPTRLPTSASLPAEKAILRLAGYLHTQHRIASPEPGPRAAHLAPNLLNREAPAPMTPAPRTNTKRENKWALIVVVGIVGFLVVGALLSGLE
jgi:hypothetical protein